MRHAEATGDGQGIRPSRNAGHQPVRWRQRLHVELDARVLHPWGRERKRFELGVMRGRDDQGSQLQETADNRPGQSRALLGIGAGAELVEQHEIV